MGSAFTFAPRHSSGRLRDAGRVGGAKADRIKLITFIFDFSKVVFILFYSLFDVMVFSLLFVLSVLYITYKRNYEEDLYILSIKEY